MPDTAYWKTLVVELVLRDIEERVNQRGLRVIGRQETNKLAHLSHGDCTDSLFVVRKAASKELTIAEVRVLCFHHFG